MVVHMASVVSFTVHTGIEDEVVLVLTCMIDRGMSDECCRADL